MSIESMMPSNHLILYCTLHLLLSIFPSQELSENKVLVVGEESKYDLKYSTTSGILVERGKIGNHALVFHLLNVSHSVLSDFL